ncbi:hypothetical protein MY553_10045, partial [Haemophilus influenzae]|uniref:hypothetical protein n=1 Tax=Haemophilus influenzae TaxID=727 RepID=UPI001958EB69
YIRLFNWHIFSPACSLGNKKAPTVSDQGCKILSCVCHALKPQLTEYSTLSLASNQVFFR